MKKHQRLNEDHDVTAEDGQPRDHFYVPSVMGQRDVITNILDKFTRAGVSHTFQGDDLIITAVTYSHNEQAKVEIELGLTIAEVVKFLKDEYKATVGKALRIGKEESSNFDCVSNYTTNKLSLCRLTKIYELPESEAGDDAGADKGELPGNIPVLSALVKENKDPHFANARKGGY